MVSRSTFAVWHSHTVTTLQPSARRAFAARRSLATLSSNFRVQNGTLLFGVYANEHRGCRCQKQPWTRTTIPCRTRTMSGRPGSLPPCKRKRNPIRCRTDRTIRSGLVSRLLIRDMFQLRCSGEIVSVTRSGNQEKTTGWSLSFSRLGRQICRLDGAAAMTLLERTYDDFSWMRATRSEFNSLIGRGR